MQYFLFILKSSFEDFRRNKIRTLLTSLGILIGVASVVLLMAFGLGLKKYIQDQFESLGTNLVIILPGKILQGGSFRSSSGAFGAKFDDKDTVSLKKIRAAEYVVPVYTKTVKVETGGNSEFTDVFAASNDIFPTRNLEVDFGRVFEKSDVEKRSKIVVIGPKLAEKLFGSKEAAILKNLKIENQNFQVVGVLKPKGGGGFGGPEFDMFIYMPYKTAYVFNPDKKILAFYLKAQNESVVEEIKKEVKTTLLKRYKEDDFSVVEQTEILNAVNSIFSMLNLVLVSIAAISLIVGGIGIMNIMYVSVIERVREIGIRRALGATQKDILLQFLTEAVILSLLGGLLGLLASFLIVSLIQRIFPAYINLTSVLVAVGVSSAIGIIFGVFPAKKAASLSPIEAIRYE